MLCESLFVFLLRQVEQVLHDRRVVRLHEHVDDVLQVLLKVLVDVQVPPQGRFRAMFSTD